MWLMLALLGCGPGAPPRCLDCSPAPPLCGNGLLDADEVCDDGVNDGRYNGCASDCRSVGPSCGDALITDDEVCDDGVNDGAYGGCIGCWSLADYCGDGRITHDEVCDDGVNDGAYNGCSSGCGAIGPTCGDGILQGDEACDDGVNDGSYGGCDRCEAWGPRCGDGLITDGEVCDDGLNDGAYGGCDPGCQSVAPRCGDGRVDAGEVCDDFVNDGRYGGCNVGCGSLAEYCGDGLLHNSEVCDDGLNDGAYQGCMPYCGEIGPYCGDGLVHPEELCDDGVNSRFFGGCQPGCQSEDESDEIFAPGQVHLVEITLDDADWEALRTQTRNRYEMFAGEECLDGPFGSPFTYFPGQVRINGEAVGTVGVRKKGFLGSLNDTKPSLKIDFAEFDDDIRWRGQKRMVLNNDIADTAHMKQCATFDIFRDQGLLAPRCNYARVMVNGVDMGVYSHVEVLKKQFFRHFLGNDSGNLYEGTLSDFHPVFVRTFEQDLNEDVDDTRSDLAAVMEAMEMEDDAAFLARLEDLFVMDEFFHFWATESMTGHWDGYSGNQNNFYMYADPARDGKFVFVAWGADHTLYVRAGRPQSVQVMPSLHRRIWATEEGKARYMAALQDVLDTWDADAILANIEVRDQALLAAMTPEEAAAAPALVDPIREFVSERVQSVSEAIADGPEAWEVPERENFCLLPRGTATVSIHDSMWNPLELGAWEECPNEIFDVVLDGTQALADRLRCRSGVHVNNRHYFQLIADDTSVRNVRYTVTMLFPTDAASHHPQVVNNFTTPWYVGLSEYDLSAGAVLRNMEINNGTLDISSYPLVDAQPATIRISGNVSEWER